MRSIANIEKGYDIDRIETDASKIVFDVRVLPACRISCEGYPDGCPNHCKHPPMDETKKMIARSVKIVMFVINCDLDKLRAHYDGRLNQRWWQKHARSLLDKEIAKECELGDRVLGCGSWDSMEAAGMLVMGRKLKTNGIFELHGIEYEWPVVHVAKLIAMLAKMPHEPAGLARFGGKHK